MFKNVQLIVCVYYKSEQQQQKAGVNYATWKCVCVPVFVFNDDNELEASIKDNKRK